MPDQPHDLHLASRAQRPTLVVTAITVVLLPWVVLSTIGRLAGWLPAWRASRIDPAEVLREG